MHSRKIPLLTISTYSLHVAPPDLCADEQSHGASSLHNRLILDVLKENIARAGVPDVTEVWAHEVGGSRLFLAVAIKQRYPGHAVQAGHIAAMCHAGAYLGRFVIVVDEDVDVTNLEEVIWAACTRCDPADAR